MKRLKESKKNTFSCYSLELLLGDLKENGITDFSKVTFELSFDGCYYESDVPTIVAVYQE